MSDIKAFIFDKLKSVDFIKIALAVTMMISFHTVVRVLLVTQVPDGSKEIIIHSLGLIEGVLITLANYYWGSSSGSKEKTEVIADMKKKE
jgi:hypothetical protein